MTKKPWLVAEYGHEIHTIPEHDHIDHPASTECPCGPEISLEGVALMVKHHSLDGRELAEEGTRYRMSRDNRDQRGGHTGAYGISNEAHADFAKQCRRAARAKAKQALRNQAEPEPIYPVEKQLYD